MHLHIYSRHFLFHSLLNYAQWCIVSPESILAQLKGRGGYIAQCPTSIILDGQSLQDFTYVPGQKLVWIRFQNNAQTQKLARCF
jgi:hypothetical protein